MNQFKRAQVIMLPTNKKAILSIKNGLIQSYNRVEESVLIHNLYIISDDERKEEDWIYNELSGVGKYVKNEEFNDGIVVIYNKQGFEVAEDIKNVKKIIATTDTSLTIDTEIFGKNRYKQLPQPSQQFIEKYIESYNKGEVISDILVEYENYFREALTGIPPRKSQVSFPDELRLKVNPKDNTITIKKVKNSWDKDEVRLLLWTLARSLVATPSMANDKDTGEWIENSL